MGNGAVVMSGVRVSFKTPPKEATRAELAAMQTQFTSAKARLDGLSAKLGVQDRSISGSSFGPPRGALSPTDRAKTVKAHEAARVEVYELATNTLALAHKFLDDNGASVKRSSPRAAGKAPPDISQGPAYKALEQGQLVKYLDGVVAGAPKK